MLEFNNVLSAVRSNDVRASQLSASAVAQSNWALDRVAQLLQGCAADLGVFGIRLDGVRSDVMSGQAFRAGGMEMWALALHAESLLALSGLPGRSCIFTAPADAQGGEFLLGARPYLDTTRGSMPVNVSVLALTAACTHLCLTCIQDNGYTLAQWDELPFDEAFIESGGRDINLAGYLLDLEHNWLSLMRMDVNGMTPAALSEQVANWPVLLTKDDAEDSLVHYQRIVHAVAASLQSTPSMDQVSVVQPQPGQSQAWLDDEPRGREGTEMPTPTAAGTFASPGAGHGI